MHIYSTFAAALLSAAETTERANALKACPTEPRFERRADGATFVTFSSPAFTLILDRSPSAGTWAYRWTWTDTARSNPRTEFAANVQPADGGTQTVTVKAHDAAQAAEKLAAMGYTSITNVVRI